MRSILRRRTFCWHRQFLELTKKIVKRHFLIVGKGGVELSEGLEVWIFFGVIVVEEWGGKDLDWLIFDEFVELVEIALEGILGRGVLGEGVFWGRRSQEGSVALIEGIVDSLQHLFEVFGFESHEHDL